SPRAAPAQDRVLTQVPVTRIHDDLVVVEAHLRPSQTVGLVAPDLPGGAQDPKEREQVVIRRGVGGGTAVEVEPGRVAVPVASRIRRPRRTLKIARGVPRADDCEAVGGDAACVSGAVECPSAQDVPTERQRIVGAMDARAGTQGFPVESAAKPYP